MGDRAAIYRKKDSTKIIAISKHSNHTVEYSRAILAQAGMTPQEIDSFIAQCIQN
jgi:hypothetical protein